MPTILVIEDDENFANLIGQHLRRKGLDVRFAADGGSGLRAFAAGTYDLLLVDAKLPVLSGDEVCRKIRGHERGRDLPLIMMSGTVKNGGSTAELTRELGLSGFLTKPFPFDALFSLIMTALQPRKSGPARTSPAVSQAPQLPLPIRGDLSRTPFAQVLLYLYLKRGTGVLQAGQGPSSRIFSFIGGAPCEIDVPGGAADFGNYLSSKNLVTPAELLAYEQLRERSGTDPRELFVKTGALAPERFAGECRNFLQERILDCFSWKSGQVMFEWRHSFLMSAPAAAALLPGLFYRGFKTHLPASKIASYIEDKGNLYVDRTTEFYEVQNHLAGELSGTELFDLINGVTTCSGIVSVVDSDDAALVLYTLDHLKALAYSPVPRRSSAEPPFPVRERKAKQPKKEAEIFEDLGGELSELAEEIAGIEVSGGVQAGQGDADVQTALENDLRQQWEEIKDKNYYEIFGMTQNSFSFEKLKSAYFDLTRTYGPEKFFASSGQVMELAEELLSLVSNAYTTLSDVVSKENYDALLAQKAPTGAEEKQFYEQVQFQSGKVLIEKGQYESAEKVFTTCLTLNPDKPEYQVYLALAIYGNPANRDNAAAIKRAKDLVNRSLLWEKLAIAYALKGAMLLDEGMLNLAEAEFKKALKQNPNNKTALKNLEVIRQKREEEEKKGGIFQKLFK